MKLSLALTHFERFDWLSESFGQVRDDPRIEEIVICDDASTDGSYERLEKEFKDDPKVKLFQNPQNLQPYANKHQAVWHCQNNWVVLFDSDNILTPAYLQALEAMTPLNPLIAYLPSFAEPVFDYSVFDGQIIDRHNLKPMMGNMLFETALNTGNHVVFRGNYLQVFRLDINPGTYEAMYQNYCWLKAGYSLQFVPGMSYFHRMHDGSYVMTNEEETGMIGAIIRYQLASL